MEPDELNGQDAPLVPDREDRTEAALEEWNKPAEETPPPEPKPGDAGAGAGDKGAVGKTEAADKTESGAAEKKTPEAPAPADITKAPFFNEPAFQEYYKKAEENSLQVAALHDVFEKGRYAIRDEATLKAVHEDAFTLYDIAAGKAKVDGLLDLFEKNWDPAVFKDVLGQMVAYATAKGVTPPEPGAEQTPENKLIAELRDKVTKLEATVSGKGQQTPPAEDPETKDRMENVVTPLMSKIAELCKAEDVTDEKEIYNYNLGVTDIIGRMKPAEKERVLAQVKAGKWGEVERLFAEYHNGLVERARKTANAATTKALADSKKIPKVPAGGSNPSPARKVRDLKTSDGRTSAALDEWKKTGS